MAKAKDQPAAPPGPPATVTLLVDIRGHGTVEAGAVEALQALAAAFVAAALEAGLALKSDVVAR